MPLPDKDYFSLEEIAKRWGIPATDIEHYAAHANLVVSVRILDDVWVEVGQSIHVEELGYVDKPEHILPVCRSVQGLRPEDLDSIFRQGKAYVDKFQPSSGEGYRRIDAESPVTKVLITRDDLIITRAERDRFEHEHEIDATAPPKALDASDIYSTGLPGRRTSRHLFEPEFRRRAKAQECESKLMAEARALHEWLLSAHPDAPSATPKTIANRIRYDYNKLVRNRAQN